MTRTDLHKMAGKANKGKLLLREALEFINDDDLISVGSGSGYFEICTKKQFLKETDDLDKQFYDNAKDAYNRAKEMWKGCLSGMPNQETDPIEDWIKWNEELSNKSKDLKTTQDWYQGFPAMLDRHVTDIFEREAEEGLAIQVEGPEVGKLWFEDEKHVSAKKQKRELPNEILLETNLRKRLMKNMA